MYNRILKQLQEQVAYYYYDSMPDQVYYGVTIDGTLYSISVCYADVIDFIDIYEYESVGECVERLDAENSDWLEYIARRIANEYQLDAE